MLLLVYGATQRGSVVMLSFIGDEQGFQMLRAGASHRRSGEDLLPATPLLTVLLPGIAAALSRIAPSLTPLHTAGLSVSLRHR
jgi:hypothetical protein